MTAVVLLRRRGTETCGVCRGGLAELCDRRWDYPQPPVAQQVIGTI